MAWSATEIPDQTGKVAVVTGANSGLGLASTRELARHDAVVVMGVRSLEKGRRAAEAIRAAVPSAALEVRELDLASIASARAFAETVMAEHSAVDLLLNNGGIMAAPPRETADGFESQVGTNHLGHFALTAWLLPALERAPAARVVTLTSFGRRVGRPLTEAALRLGDDYDAWRAYGDSKLANFQFGLELARRLAAAGSPVSSLVAHPGLARTNLQVATVEAAGAGRLGRFFQLAARWYGLPPRRAVLGALRALTDPAARNGEFYGPRWELRGAPVRLGVGSDAAPPAATDELWRVSAAATGTTLADHRT